MRKKLKKEIKILWKKINPLFSLFILLFSLFFIAQFVPLKEIEINEIQKGKHENFAYNGYDQDLLKEIDIYSGKLFLNKNVEHHRYFIYDRGITEYWVHESYPVFIRELPTGADPKKNQRITLEMDGSIYGDFPEELRASIYDSFSMDDEGGTKVIDEVPLLGPMDERYGSREYYYKDAYHRHKLKIVEQVLNENGDIIDREEYKIYILVPVVRIYYHEHLAD